MKSKCILTVHRGVAGHQNKFQQACSSKQGSPCQAKGVQHGGCCAGTAASTLGWTNQSTPALNSSRLATLGTFRSVQRVDCVCGELGEGLLKCSCFLRFFTRFLQVEVHLSLHSSTPTGYAVSRNVSFKSHARARWLNWAAFHYPRVARKGTVQGAPLSSAVL
jgi:hypothetical protein